MSKWPPIYEATVRTWCPKKNEEVRSKIHVLLPHEIVEALCENGDIDKMHEVLCDPQTFEHLEKQKRAHGLTRAVPLGFWMDGIPYNSNREESLDVLTYYELAWIGWGICSAAHTPSCYGPFYGLREHLG